MDPDDPTAPAALLRRASRLTSEGDLVGALDLLVEVERRDPEADVAFRARIAQCVVLRRMGDEPGRFAVLERQERLAEQLGRPGWQAMTLLERGVSTETSAGRALVDRAVELADRDGDPEVVVEVRLHRVRARLRTGDVAGAGEDAEVAARASERAAPGSLTRVIVPLHQGQLALERGGFAEALALAELATARAEALGAAIVRPHLANLRGDALRGLGRVDEADAAWASAEAGGLEVAAINRVVASLVRERWDEARARLDAPRLLAPRTRLARAQLDVCRALVLAADGRWEAAATRVAAAVDDLRETRNADGELADLFGRIAALAVAAGSPTALRVAVRASAGELDVRARRGADAAAVHDRLRALAARGAPVQLGRVRLLEVLGGGGLGQVWRGVHDGGAAVAVKVLRVDASSPRARRMVLEEVCTLAALDHPNVVWLLGYGFVDAAAETMGVGAVGAPYLVLELAAGGTLAGRCGRLDWPEARAALLQVLDGLAHAHARGRVHLDLKPANVLLGGSGDGVCKIADFGLARMVGAVDRRPGAGTPEYMAPEQFVGGRRVGPWTDLYALGCLATELVTGTPPFRGAGPAEVRRAHEEDEPPPLPQGCPVPPGFDAWRRRLLAKDPEERFASAAEAAEALLALAATSPLRALGADLRQSLSAAPTRLAHPGSDRGASQPHTLLFEREEAAVGPAPAPERTRRRRPVPQRFATAGSPRRATLVEASLQLFSLRAPPLVGRMRERQLLWGALRDVAERGTSGGVVLAGTPGVGASRLGEWLLERASELDVARVVRLRPSTDGATLAADLVADLGAPPGASADDPTLVSAIPDPLEREAVVEAAAGRLGGDRAARRAWRRHLERLAAAGPVVVALDGPPPGDPARALVAEVLGGPWPVLFVVVVRSDDDPLSEHPAVLHLPVEPMSDEALGAVLDARLTLDPRLRRALLDAAAGRPATAVQILADLVGREALVPGTGGWNLAPGEAPRLPTDHRRALVERATAAGVGGVLGVLAVVGEAAEEALAGVAEAAGEAFPRELLERAVQLGLADRIGETLRMPQATATALVEAMDPARLRALHAAAAARATDPARVASHRIGAGEPLLALEPLREAVRASSERPDRAQRLLADWEEALRLGRVAPTDPRRAAWWVERATVAMVAGDAALLAVALDTLSEGRDRHGWPIDPAQVGLHRGDLFRLTDRWEDAAGVWRAALEAVGPPESDEARRLHGLLLHRLAAVRERAGDLPEAIRLLRRAVELLPSGRVRAAVSTSLANHLSEAGALDEAEAVLTRAAADAAGPIGHALVTQGRAVLAAYRGDWARAATLHREVVGRFEVVGLFRPIARMNLVSALIALDRDDEARGHLHLLGGQLSPASSHARYLRALWLMESAPAPDDRFERLVDELSTGPRVEALLLDVAARRALQAGRPDRVRRLDALRR